MHLTPYEQHPSQFRTGELREGPRLTAMRILVGSVVVFAVFGFGYAIRWTGRSLPNCYLSNRARCSAPIGSGVSLPVWLIVATVVGAVVVAWPLIAQAIRRLVGRTRDASHGVPTDDRRVPHR
jgi:hypothetical protein